MAFIRFRFFESGGTRTPLNGPARSIERQGHKGSSTLTTLQMGRGLAAFAVAAFHLSLMMGLARYGGVPVLQHWTQHGSLGVYFFFVLSGFIILMAHYDDIGRPARLRRYLWRRFVRVYPIYWLYTGVFVALVLAGLGNNTPMPSTATGWLSAFTLIRFSAEAPPIGPAWTLFHEVAFYAIFGLLILNRRVGLLVMGLWLVVCVVLWHYPPDDGRTALAVYTAAYSAQFALGMLAYLAYRHLHWRACIALGVAGLAVLGAAYYTSDSFPPPFQWTCGFAGLLLICASAERRSGLRAPGWLRYIGDASYSLYLLHIALIGLLLKVAIETGLAEAVGGLGTFALTLVGATLLACLAYRMVEAPMLRALRSGVHFGSRRSPPVPK